MARGFILIIALLLSGCVTARGRFLVGAGMGAAVIGGAATALSPNSESRGMNALVFGLVGALLGGGLGLLTADDGKVPKSEGSLKEKEQASRTQTGMKLYPVPVDSGLPDFLKERLQAPVIEELVEPDSVSDDGTLHEPHKIYRIQRNAELYAVPQKSLLHGKGTP